MVSQASVLLLGLWQGRISWWKGIVKESSLPQGSQGAMRKERAREDRVRDNI